MYKPTFDSPNLSGVYFNIGRQGVNYNQVIEDFSAMMSVIKKTMDNSIRNYDNIFVSLDKLNNSETIAKNENVGQNKLQENIRDKFTFDSAEIN